MHTSKIRQAFRKLRLLPHASHLLAELINATSCPTWIHVVGANLWYVNDAYAELFNIPREDIWHSYNILLEYPPEVLSSYLAADLIALERGCPVSVIEPVTPSLADKNQDFHDVYYLRILKIPVRHWLQDFVIGQAFLPQDSADTWYLHASDEDVEKWETLNPQ